MLEVRLLGRFEMKLEGKPVEIPSRPVQSLLAYLILNPGIKHRREKLGGLLWPDSDETNARSNLRHALWRLRKAIGERYFIADKVSIAFNSDSDYELDVDILENETSIEGPIEELIATGRIFDGELLPGFHDEWVVLERERLQVLYEKRMQTVLDRLMDEGRWTDVIDWAEQWIATGQVPESAFRAMMLAYSAIGEFSKAAAVYQRCVETLNIELGVQVSEKTRELYERLARGERPVELPIEAPLHNLPEQLTTFIGRDQELREISQLIGESSCHLLTLVGPGGIGKTRLALQTATQRLEDYPHGTYFIPLAPVPSSEYLVPSIADALHFTFDTHSSDLDPKSQLLDYLGGRSMLMVIDNFEHLIDGATLLVELIEHAPQIKLLVTSREKLNLHGEWIFNVDGMRFPENGDGADVAKYSALALFHERARQVDSDFNLSGTTQTHATRICQLVDGMPLGIELAAAWVSVLSCEEIAQEIEKNIDFLSTSMPNVPSRHRSLRAAFDHSWNLLTEAQREGFLKLSVFRGGFFREAAETVAGVSLQLLSDLVNKSLLRRHANRRYEVHELLRQYAEEKLKDLPQEKESVHDKHADYYVEFLTERGEDFWGDRLKEIKDEIRVEMENVRAAIHWAVIHWEDDDAREAMIVYADFYTVHGWHAGREAFEIIAKLLQKMPIADAETTIQQNTRLLSAWAHQARFFSDLGDHEAAIEIAKKCLPTLRELGIRKELAICLYALGVSAVFQGMNQEAKLRLEEVIAIGKETMVHNLDAIGLVYLGWVFYVEGDLEQARALFQEGYQICVDRGNHWARAFLTSKLGLVEDGLKNYEQAMEYHQESMAYFTEFGDRAGEAYSTSRMSMVSYGMEAYREAKRFGRLGLEIFEEIGHRWGKPVSLCRIGFAAIGTRELKEARDCFYEALEDAMDAKMIQTALYALLGITSLMAVEGETEQAIELMAFIKQHPNTPQIYIDSAERWVTDVEVELPREVIDAAKERGEDRELEEVVKEILKVKSK